MPLRKAEVLASPLTAVVVITGGEGVTNESTAPNDVPTALEAIAQK